LLEELSDASLLPVSTSMCEGYAPRSLFFSYSLDSSAISNVVENIQSLAKQLLPEQNILIHILPRKIYE
jgi:hypothetical protein